MQPNLVFCVHHRTKVHKRHLNLALVCQHTANSGAGRPLRARALSHIVGLESYQRVELEIGVSPCIQTIAGIGAAISGIWPWYELDKGPLTALSTPFHQRAALRGCDAETRGMGNDLVSLLNPWAILKGAQYRIIAIAGETS